jgi:hypothetical protein
MPEMCEADDVIHRLATVEPGSWWFTRRNELIGWTFDGISPRPGEC